MATKTGRSLGAAIDIMAVTRSPKENASDNEERRPDQRNIWSSTTLVLLRTWTRCRVYMLTLLTGTKRGSQHFNNAKSEAVRAPEGDMVITCYGSRVFENYILINDGYRKI